MRRLLKTVLRFDDTTYKLGRTGLSSLQTDLAGLADCTRRLIYEIDVEAVATGLQVHVEVTAVAPSSDSWVKTYVCGSGRHLMRLAQELLCAYRDA